MGGTAPDSGAHLRGTAREGHRLVFSWSGRYWRGDLQHLVTVVIRAVHEAHEQRCARQLRERHGPGQEPGLDAEERHLHGASQVALQRWRVDRDRRHLIGPQGGRGLRRDPEPPGPRLDVRPVPVASQSPGVDQVPESPLDR